MKKITFLLTLLSVGASSAFAGVLTPSTDSESHVFAIKNPNNNYYCTVNGSGIGSTQTKGAVAFFKAYAGSADGQYYLFCTTNNKYVTYTGTPTGGPAKVLFTDSKDDAKQWKISLESNQTERYDIFPEDVTGNTGDLSWNWHGGVGNNMGFYAASDANSTWTFEAAIENITFTYNFNGSTVTTKTASALSGADKSAAPSAGYNYVNSSSMSPETIAEGTTNYTVELAEALPFTKSASFDNATWYVMDMHCNDSGTADVLSGEKNYTWTYSAADADVTLPKQVMSEATYSDNMLWCFVGDAINGFKIYNKAAGSSLTLRKAETGNTAAVMSATDDHNQFKLYPTNQNITNGFCLKLDGDDYYVNTQEVNSVKVLRGWNENDGGSTCRVFALNKFVVDAATPYNNGYIKSSELPAGALGENSYLEEGDNLANFKTAYAAANTTSATLDQVNALSTIMKSVKASQVATAVEAGKYYRLYNARDKKWLCVRSTDNTKMTTDANAGNLASSVVTFDNAETGRFRMKIEGKTFGKRVSNNTPITLEADNSNNKGSYVVSNIGRVYTFYDMASNVSDRSYLHCNNSTGNGNVVGWDDGDMDGPSRWYVVPATEAEITMNTVGSNTYATAYLPFPVSAVSGAKAYVGKLNDAKDALDMTNVESIPANTGVVFEGTGNTATLTIGTATTTVADNILTGSNTDVTVASDALSSYLVLGVSDNTIGFYTPASTVTKLTANKAYINASDVTTTGSALKLNFGGNDATGIKTIAVDGNGFNAPIYDLSGRRVIAPAKGGVYIQNGKKFIK